MNAIEVLLFQWGSWVAQVAPQPGPDEPNPGGQMLMSLGLSGAMLVGFLFLVAILIGAMLVMGWSAHRDVDGRTV